MNELVNCPNCNGTGDIEQYWDMECPWRGCPCCQGDGLVTEEEAARIRFEILNETD